MSEKKDARAHEELRAHIHAELDRMLTPELLDICRKRDNLAWFLCVLKQESLRIVKNWHRKGDDEDTNNPLRHLTRYE